MGYEREKVVERLADLRKERKLSLEKLSKAIEEKTGVYISGPQLNKYENTERVKKGKIEKITDIMSAKTRWQSLIFMVCPMTTFSASRTRATKKTIVR